MGYIGIIVCDTCGVVENTIAYGPPSPGQSAGWCGKHAPTLVRTWHNIAWWRLTQVEDL